MKPQVIRRPRALLDLVEHFDYIAVDSPGAAQRFLDAVERAFTG